MFAMELPDFLTDLDLAGRALSWGVSVAPTVGKFTATLLIGVALARAASRATRWAALRVALEDRLVSWGAERLLTTTGTRGGLHDALARAVWWLGLASTAYLVAELMGWTGVSALFFTALAFTPRLLTSMLILGAGVLGAEVASRAVRAALARRPDFEEPELVGKAAGALIVVVAASVAAEQLGFAVGLIHALVTLGFASLALAASLTFSLGGAPLLGQLVAGYYARRTFSTGDVLDVAGARGRLLHFAPTGVVLEDGPASRHFIPYRALTETAIRRAPTHDE
jgi:hypothetical protein